jgi:ABC-type sugar transport system ATPase subunit
MGSPSIEGADAVRPLVEVNEVSKRFGGVQAVDAVSVSILPGSVHGLVGENGAGKSTLAKIIGGVHEPDDGRVLVDGEPVRFRSPRDALAAGIATIAQEIALVPARTVVENVFLGIETRRLGVIDRSALSRRFAELDARTGFRLDPEARVGALRTAEQQKVEIMRAIARDARLILMDEPTASLTADESERLLDIIRDLAGSGTSVVLVSHHLDEVLAICRTITVMRDGRLVRTTDAEGETEQSLVNSMVGRALELTFPPKRPAPADAPPVLEAAGLTRTGAVADVSLTVRAGEIVGLAGLVGSGRTEVARLIFGADKLDAGEIRLNGEPVNIRGPRQAAGLGIALIPESRKEQGLLMVRSIRENATLATVGQFTTAGVMRTDREDRRAGALAERLDVRAPNLKARVGSLSGGNQQKVLFAKWLATEPKLLIADEPTRGIDVAAKQQIHKLIADLAADGMAVLLISSEIEEVLGLAHRVLVMRGGRVVEELSGAEATQETVMRAAFAAPATTSEGDRS